jgi:FkbM family methyltransferase
MPLAVRDLAVRRMLFSDHSSRRAFRRAYGAEGGEAIPLRLRALGGEPIWVRPGHSDLFVLREAFTYKDALPPRGCTPKRIFDVGANIGATMALLAAALPDAEIVGFEPDPGTAELCRRNVERWKGRCQVVQSALFTEDGEVQLAGDWKAGLRVSDDDTGISVPAISLPTALERYGDVDYLKLDVEGAEARLLARPVGWERVACVNVEVHAPYETDACARDLTALGFGVALERGPREPRVIGRRL